MDQQDSGTSFGIAKEEGSCFTCLLGKMKMSGLEESPYSHLGTVVGRIENQGHGE
jgi:hypothetical protein